VRNQISVACFAAALTLIACDRPGDAKKETSKFLSAASVSASAWTIMVFINADNDLDSEVLQNIRQMAELPQNPSVNFVVQIDRRGNGNNITSKEAGGIRVKVTPQMRTSSYHQIWTSAEQIPEPNMGDPAALRGFVEWAKTRYPADRNMLVIWNHGFGWRLMLTQALARVSDRSRKSVGSVADTVATSEPSPEHPFRSISTDENPMDQLYNREIHSALSGLDIDVIGFDACFMAMVETAYAVRDDADVLIASEEQEPPEGWNYKLAFLPLARSAQPDTVGPDEIGKMVVAGFQQAYGDNGPTTLSAVNLKLTDSLASSIDRLSDALMSVVVTKSKALQTARHQVYNYGTLPTPVFHNVDLAQLMSEFGKVNISIVSQDAKVVRQTLQSMVIARYASKSRRSRFGSFGLAIYFPENRGLYRSDPLTENGYERQNTFFPVAFVAEHKWGDFLHTYFEQVH
jgi:hypothetical protein